MVFNVKHTICKGTELGELGGGNIILVKMAAGMGRWWYLTCCLFLQKLQGSYPWRTCMLIMMQYHQNVKHTPMPSEDHIYPRPFLEAREDLSLGFATVRSGTRRLGHLASGRRSSALDRLLSLELCKLRQGYYYSRVCRDFGCGLATGAWESVCFFT